MIHVLEEGEECADEQAQLGGKKDEQHEEEEKKEEEAQQRRENHGKASAYIERLKQAAVCFDCSSDALLKVSLCKVLEHLGMLAQRKRGLRSRTMERDHNSLDFDGRIVKEQKFCIFSFPVSGLQPK